VLAHTARKRDRRGARSSEEEKVMTTGRTALLAAMGLIASTLLAGAQEVGAAQPQVAASATSQPVDATAAMHALLRDPAMKSSIGLAENSYDFNAPNGVPGFGPIDSPPIDRRYVRVIGQ
jgi:hypothetical protein